MAVTSGGVPPPYFGIQAAESAIEREAGIVDAAEGEVRERADEAGGKACLGVVAPEERGGKVACTLRIAGEVRREDGRYLCR